jgi:hypothetical protein
VIIADKIKNRIHLSTEVGEIEKLMKAVNMVEKRKATRYEKEQK